MRHLPLSIGFLALCLIVCPAEAAQPNVLFIAVDDLRVELGCYGQSHVQSPNIDRLASQGTLFERAYCQQTVCNPSRASLLTGMRPDTLRAWDLPTHFRQNRPDAVTLPQCFKKHGYHTQCVGKIFHNWRQDDWKGDPVSWSVPSVLHYGTHGSDKPEVEGAMPPNLASGKDGIECRDVPDNAYFDGRVAEAAINALDEVSRKGKPFFLAVGFWKPHTPFNAPKKYWDLYDRATIPVPQHVTPPNDVPDVALTSARYQGGANAEVLREMHHGHLAAISYLDAQVGKVLAKLDEWGLREETIIVFWSDHGLHLGEHGLTRKTTVFELDARVPLIIATPQHQPGQRTGALVELLDLYPTLAELCGLDAPQELEGVSLSPLLSNPKSRVKEAALTQTPRPNYLRGKLPETMGYSMRTKRYRYTQWQDFQTGRLQARELYDHDTDPLEMTNLAGREKHSELVAMLARKLDSALGNPPDQVARPGEGGYLLSEFLYDIDQKPTPQCHASTIVETPSGLVAAWFGGTNEPHVDNSIWLSRHVDGKWLKPVEIVDGSEGRQQDHRTGNPVLFQPKDGPLMLFYKVVPRVNGRASTWWGMLTISWDDGKTWSAPWKLGEDNALGSRPHLIGPVKNKPIQLADGAILCPSSSEHDGWRVHFEVTRDFGRTWKVIGPMNDESAFNAIQPSILTYPDGRMQILCRSKDGVIAESWSSDGGRSWSPMAATELPNPNAGTDAVTLNDGRQLLVYNHTVRSGQFPAGRNMLNVATSRDGKNWKPLLTLERDRGEFSYPAVIQTSDGKVHITYTWNRQTIKHVVLNPEKVASATPTE
ncbi:exo-alpha-sialidase [Roseiconus nitratireducens]|uniref:exo-alpha-sialidase n=1 Tax=Roseiconus nitratireducens TaxID=2605748 RepID=UPI001F2D3AA8|nr:exo-alpha-sialidase [Roseiconus nitratireducens]